MTAKVFIKQSKKAEKYASVDKWIFAFCLVR